LPALNLAFKVLRTASSVRGPERWMRSSTSPCGIDGAMLSGKGKKDEYNEYFR